MDIIFIPDNPTELKELNGSKCSCKCSCGGFWQNGDGEGNPVDSIYKGVCEIKK